MNCYSILFFFLWYFSRLVTLILLSSISYFSFAKKMSMRLERQLQESVSAREYGKNRVDCESKTVLRLYSRYANSPIVFLQQRDHIVWACFSATFSLPAGYHQKLSERATIPIRSAYHTIACVCIHFVSWFLQTVKHNETLVVKFLES